MQINDKIEQQHLLAQYKLSLLTNYYFWPLKVTNFQFGKRVWDSSAGIGNLSKKIVQNCDFLLVTEYTEKNLKILNENFIDYKKVVIEKCDLSNFETSKYQNYKIDTIINFDVLEHIEDDVKVLKNFYEVLAPNGKLIIKTPAHPNLYCEIDRQSLHYRRYSKKEICNKLTNIGFTIEKIRYINFIGAIAYFLKGKILKKKNNFSNTFSNKKLIIINKFIPFLILVDKLIKIPFGLSIVVVATKKDS
ncbi:MAG: methyltransferase [Bacteroidales bacterium]|nr:methyltransferase [Bacteroidales bacterium]